MIGSLDCQKQPYQLAGAEYATWYEVGQRLGVFAQSMVATALCNGSRMLPVGTDIVTAAMIKRVAAGRGIPITVPE